MSGPTIDRPLAAALPLLGTATSPTQPLSHTTHYHDSVTPLAAPFNATGFLGPWQLAHWLLQSTAKEMQFIFLLFEEASPSPRTTMVQASARAPPWRRDTHDAHTRSVLHELWYFYALIPAHQKRGIRGVIINGAWSEVDLERALHRRSIPLG